MFLQGKWRAIEDRDKLRLKFGENLDIMKRSQTYKPAPKGHIHANQHLLNKDFAVPLREPQVPTPNSTSTHFAGHPGVSMRA